MRPMTDSSTTRDHAPRSLAPAICASCDSDAGELVVGNDPDGFFLCRECLSRLDAILSRGRQPAT